MPHPTVSVDIVRVMHSITSEYTTGWPGTIVGTYQTIADVVNSARGTTYDTGDIGWGLTWLHQWGPDALGATVNKVGPGNTGLSELRLRYSWNPTAKTWDLLANPVDVVLDGHVFMLVVDGRELGPDQRLVVRDGLMRWCDYRISTLRNDVIDLSMYRSTLPASDPTHRPARRALNRAIREFADEITTVQDLQTTLASIT